MRTREFVAVGLKIMAVYVFFQFLMMLPTLVTTFQMRRLFGTGDEAGSPAAHLHWLRSIYYIVVTVAYLGFALGTFAGARRLSRFFVEDPESRISLAGPVSGPMLTAAFQCMGVYALATWTPNFVQVLVRCVIYGAWVDPQLPILRRIYDNWSALFTPATGILIGLLLVFRAGGLLRLIRLSRPASRERIEAESNSASPG